MVKDQDTIELEDKYNELSCNSSDTQITYVNSSVSYNTFFRSFLVENKPCILKFPTYAKWKSTEKWVVQDVPNFASLEDLYGQITVPVADCGEKYYNVQKKCPTLFSEYLKYWKEYIENGYPSCMPCLYLKDWHFTKDFPTHSVYRVPQYFASDWLNEFLASKTKDIDDYRFVYMGPKGSWTPLHADVFTSFSWSINICGKKRWLLFPPGQEQYLLDKYGNLVYDATCPSLLDSKSFPDCHKPTPFDIIQGAGEAIFVPTGWHHQVWNLEDTISINHNWINGCNIEKMWFSMQKNLTDVKKEIADCKDMEDWEEHSQIMLQAVFGMNYEEFFKFINYIANSRINSLKSNTPVILYGDWRMGKQHMLFDLQQIKGILKSFLSNRDVQSLKFYSECVGDIEQLSAEVEAEISKFAT